MSTILRFLPALACVGLMFVCMRGMFGGSGGSPRSQASRDEEIARLRLEIEDLRSSLDRPSIGLPADGARLSPVEGSALPPTPAERH
jgi:hypothetical protein